MVAPRRAARINKTIQARIAAVLHRDMKDPRLGFVTITRVEVDAELTKCRVFWSSLGNETERRLNEQALQHGRKFIQHEVAEILRTRNAPILEFLFDESIEGAIRVTRILDELAEERGETRSSDDKLRLDQPDDPGDAPD